MEDSKEERQLTGVVNCIYWWWHTFNKDDG